MVFLQIAATRAFIALICPFSDMPVVFLWRNRLHLIRQDRKACAIILHYMQFVDDIKAAFVKSVIIDHIDLTLLIKMFTGKQGNAHQIKIH